MALRALFVLAGSASLAGASSGAANPIRKVVTLLQAMQKKVTQEGEKAEDLYEKFMCYCKTSGGDLSASIAAAGNKLPQLSSSIEAAEGRKTQLEDDLKSHQSDRSAAEQAIAEATTVRRKEKAAYDKESADAKVNLDAVNKATTAISNGMGGSFLQTGAADVLRRIISGRTQILEADRQQLASFISGEQGDSYAPASGEIAGILKQMGDEMDKDLQDLISDEKQAVKEFEGLVAAKKKQVSVLTKSIEEKLERVADLGVEISTMKNDLDDTAEALAEDKKFVADLQKNCAEKSALHEEEKKIRSDEVVALADAIKILNDDDALELFKKTLPSASMSLLQVHEASRSMQSRASNILSQARSRGGKHLDFVLLALHGKKAGFGKIIDLIDELVGTLKEEQNDDDHKKEYCESQFDEADDKKKQLEQSVADLGTVIEEAKEGIATTTEEITALKAGVAALDKAVGEATKQRKAEKAEHKDLMTSDAAAKELLLFAKNRLNKFYNPKLHKSAPALVQLTSRRGAPPPPPETADAYMKKSQESNGVLAMIDLLVSDLDKEMVESETEEKGAVAEYERTMTDSAEKRRQDTKSLTDKEAAKADMTGALEKAGGDKKAATKDLMGVAKYIHSLHSECDWLIKYFDARKQARADEIDSLEKAKAVLSGADFSLLQETRSATSRKFLHRV